MQTKQMSLEDELQQHVEHSANELGEVMTDAEVASLRSKFFQCGMHEPDAELTRECGRMAGLGETATLAQISRSFRGRYQSRALGARRS